MEYDEIDDFVNGLFDKKYEPPSEEPKHIVIPGSDDVTPKQSTRQQADNAVERTREVIEREGAVHIETGKWKSPLENNEAIRATGYHATDTTGMSLERNSQVSTRTIPQAQRQRDGAFTCGAILVGILALIACGLLAMIADWISLVGV